MFKRIARLFRSMLSALIGKAEATITIPQMEEAYREMQQNLYKYKQAVASAVAYEKRAKRKLEDEERRVAGLTEKAKAAVQQSLAATDPGQKAELEKLAKRALQLRKQAEQAVATLRQAYAQAADQAQKSKQRFNVAADEVEKRARQLDQARTVADLNKSRKEVVEMTGTLNIESAAGVFDDGLERVLQESDKIDAMDSLALSEGQELDRKLTELAGSAGVDTEFADLLAEVQGVQPAPRVAEAPSRVDLDTALE